MACIMVITTAIATVIFTMARNLPFQDMLHPVQSILTHHTDQIIYFREIIVAVTWLIMRKEKLAVASILIRLRRLLILMGTISPLYLEIEIDRTGNSKILIQDHPSINSSQRPN
jgi:hypothetical protein